MRLFLVLPMILSTCGPDETISGYANPEAVYQLESIGGQSFLATATISFPEIGKVVGQGPCNTFSAEQTVPYPWIDIGPIAATRRACPDLADEAAYFEALGRVTLAEVAGDDLILTTEDGVDLVFVRQP
ncbi:MAG: META domain-containing protein [Pseudomonadota bacterium]